MPGAFHNSFSWSEGRKAGCLKYYHIVLKVNRDKALSISDQEVVERWYQLFAGNRLVDSWLKGEKQSRGEKLTVHNLIAKWRERLYGIDWFMRCLNEYMARQANKEEKVTGRFREGRYKSQALLDEGALLACMAYVDLNPIRAKMATTPEDSAFTSIQQRIKTLKQSKRKLKKSPKAKKQTQLQPQTNTPEASHASSEVIATTKPDYPTPKGLLPFSGFPESAQQETDIPFDLMDYLELVDWTGRAIKEDKRGAIPSHLSPVFERLGLNQEDWRDIVKDFSRHFTTAAGSIAHMQAMAAHTHRARCCTRKALMLYQ